MRAALAGGGAKGGAHIGVLKVLEELHVPIDCIAGTSMGALVGGGYASGMTADEIATGRTPIGTLTIGVGKATGAWAGWVTLGTPVGSGSILDRPLFR
jgi:hypothetical protein